MRELAIDEFKLIQGAQLSYDPNTNVMTVTVTPQNPIDFAADYAFGLNAMCSNARMGLCYTPFSNTPIEIDISDLGYWLVQVTGTQSPTETDYYLANYYQS